MHEDRSMRDRHWADRHAMEIFLVICGVVLALCLTLVDH